MNQNANRGVTGNRGIQKRSSNERNVGRSSLQVNTGSGKGRFCQNAAIPRVNAARIQGVVNETGKMWQWEPGKWNEPV